jgi:hypothetical protein
MRSIRLGRLYVPPSSSSIHRIPQKAEFILGLTVTLALGRECLYRSGACIYIIYHVCIIGVILNEQPSFPCPLYYSTSLATAVRRPSLRPPWPLLSEMQRASTATQDFRTRQT